MNRSRKRAKAQWHDSYCSHFRAWYERHTYWARGRHREDMMEDHL